MKVLICAAGTTGDVHPMMAIAEGLRDRGHEVILLSNEAYAGLAEEVGIGFEPVGTARELEATRNHPDAWNYSRGWKVWIQDAGLATMRRYYAAIERLNRRGDTIVAASYLCLGARLAREVLKIPTATLHLNVHTIRSLYTIYAYPPPAFLRRFFPHLLILPLRLSIPMRRRWVWLGDKLLIDPPFKRKLEPMRRELGLPKMNGFVRDWWNSPDLAIGLFPDWWAGERPDWPPQVVTTGFPFWHRGRLVEIPDDLMEFLLADEKILVFTPGASSLHTDAHFAAFVGACRKLNRRGLVLTPKRPAIEYDRDRIRFAQFVPFEKLLPHTAAVVHHAGIGTSAQCVAAGLPQVVAPTLYNQPDTAIRLERLGVARQVPSQHFTSDNVAEALKQVLTSPDVAASCREYAERMKSNHTAIPNICELLEATLEKSPQERHETASLSSE